MTPVKLKFSAIQAVLLASLCLNVIGIWWGLPGTRGWAPDEILPSRVLEGMHQFFSNNWADKYPPLQYYLLSLLYLPFFLLQKLRLLDFPELLTYTALFYVGRLLSLAMATATVYLVFRTGLEIFDKRSSLFAASITALLIPFVYYSKMANLDVPFTFWFVWSLFFFIRILKTQARKYYGLFALTAVCSVCTKDQAYGLYILPPFIIIFSHWLALRKAGRNRALIRALLSRSTLSAVLVAVVTFVVIHNFLFNARGVLNHFRLIVGPLSQNYRMFANTLSGRVHLLWETIRQIQYCQGWPLFVVCGLGLLASIARAKKNARLLSLIGFAISYYLFYINVILYNYDRFNLPICIILAFFGGRILSEAIGTGKKFRALQAAGLFLLFGYTFLYAASVDVLMVKDSRYRVERWMKENVSPDAVIGVASPLEYVPRLRNFKWVGLKLSPGVLEGKERPDYILFNVDYSRSFPEHTPEKDFFAQFYRNSSVYKMAFAYQTPLRWLPLKTRGILTNIKAINPEIRIFRRVEP